MYPTKPWLWVDVTGRRRTKQQLMKMRLELTRWTLVDVYGRLWMAPRAGYQLDRKYMMCRDGAPC